MKIYHLGSYRRGRGTVCASWRSTASLALLRLCTTLPACLNSQGVVATQAFVIGHVDIVATSCEARKPSFDAINPLHAFSPSSSSRDLQTNPYSRNRSDRSTNGRARRPRSSPPSYTFRRNRSQLAWIVKRIDGLLREPGHVIVNTSNINGRYLNESREARRTMTALQALTDAVTPADVVEAGIQIEKQLFGEMSITFSPVVSDYLLRATALTGMIALSMKLFDKVITARQLSTESFPLDDTIFSYETQEILCLNLRRLGRLSLLQHVLRSMKTRSHQNIPRDSEGRPVIMSTVAFNMILAAHCDPVLNPNRLHAGENPDDCLDTAYQLLCVGLSRSSPRLVQPDAVSFATLLQACAKARNHSLADQIWQGMLDLGVQPNVVAYNACLELASEDPRMRSQSARDQAVLQVWENLTASIQPDQYSVDWVLLPLIRSDQVSRMERILNQFIADNSQTVVSLAFTAFLSKIVASGQVYSAQKLFDRYIRPSLSPVLSGNIGTIRLVRPSTRHFNILLTGYQQQLRDRRELEIKNLGSSTSTANVTKTTGPAVTSHVESLLDSCPYENVRELYDIMRKSQDCQPNVITTTIMISMSQTSDEIVDLLRESLEFDQDGQLWMNASVLRAAVVSAGKLGDASLAGWLFISMSDLASVRDDDVRMWNVLLGALAQADRVEYSSGGQVPPTIDLIACSDRYRRQLAAIRDPDHLPLVVYELLQGNSVIQIFNRYLEQVNDPNYGKHHRFPPRPNSQTYCIITSVFQRRCPSADVATALFRNATRSGVPADGRFANAVLRCFGSDMDNAVECWKREIRPAALAHDASSRRRPPRSVPLVAGKSSMAAYHGLLYVCGRAGRPQMALRIVYAMGRDALDPDETALNCYRSGKRERQRSASEDDDSNRSIVTEPTPPATQPATGAARLVLERLKDSLLLRDGNLYESLLYVECTRYDENDKRRVGEQRVRIIV